MATSKLLVRASTTMSMTTMTASSSPKDEVVCAPRPPETKKDTATPKIVESQKQDLARRTSSSLVFASLGTHGSRHQKVKQTYPGKQTNNEPGGKVRPSSPSPTIYPFLRNHLMATILCSNPSTCLEQSHRHELLLVNLLSRRAIRQDLQSQLRVPLHMEAYASPPSSRGSRLCNHTLVQPPSCALTRAC